MGCGKHEEDEGFTVENMCGAKREAIEKEFAVENMCGGKKHSLGGMMCPMKHMKYRLVHMDMKLNILVILVGLIAVMALYCCMKQK